MNKIRTLHLLLVAMVSLICGCASQEKIQSWIIRKFRVELPFELKENDIVKQDKDWFVAVRLTKQQVNVLLSNNFDGYNGWQSNPYNMTLGTKNHYTIEESQDIFLNIKKGGEPPYNFIAIFLDTHKNVAIFYWGITYGI